eukprot:TRINITY_DN7662_c0_g1_i1.p1 TRINITY_DN7662_c0_g1~~TRINITY_DN7662_c0_g1_i1.p1  ORF type:complete len:913 (-),score=208.40 TRINITY_DN7662_c0_g1_i1:304-3042(-)
MTSSQDVRLHTRLARGQSDSSLDGMGASRSMTNMRSLSKSSPNSRKSLGEVEDLKLNVFKWVNEHKGQAVKPHQKISAVEVANTYGLPKPYLMEYLNAEITMGEERKSMPFTLLLITSFSIMALQRNNAVQIRAVEDSLRYDVTENTRFAYAAGWPTKSIDDLSSYADFWHWMRDGLIPLLFKDVNEFSEGSEGLTSYSELEKQVPTGEKGFWMRYNRIVGGIRLAQERSDPVKCRLLPELKLEDINCYGRDEYQLEPELGLPDNRALKTENPERITWLYITDGEAATQRTLQQLQTDKWLDESTEKIEIGIPTYNAEIGMHTLVRVNLYFSRGGMVWKQVLLGSQYSDWYDEWYEYAHDFVWVAMVLIIMASETMDVVSVVRQHGVSGIYTKYVSFYNALDWLSILLSFIIVTLFVANIPNRIYMNDLMEAMGKVDPVADREEYQNLVQPYMESVTINIREVLLMRQTVCIYPVIVLFRIFRVFAAQPRLALTTSTLFAAASDLFHFLVVFIAVFYVFAISGFVLFGRQIREFSTLSRAVTSAFRIIFKDIEWDALAVAGAPFAGFWLWVFSIVFTMIILNVLVAIIMDHYSHEQEATGSAETVVATIWKIIKSSRRKKGGAEDVDMKDVLKAVEAFNPGPDPVHDNRVTGQIRPDMIPNANPHVLISERQFREVLVLGLLAYYERNKNRQGEGQKQAAHLLMDRVSQRMRSLVRIVKKFQLHQEIFTVQELKTFELEVKDFVIQAREDREESLRELEKLEDLRLRLRKALARSIATTQQRAMGLAVGGASPQTPRGVQLALKDGSASGIACSDPLGPASMSNESLLSAIRAAAQGAAAAAEASMVRSQRTTSPMMGGVVMDDFSPVGPPSSLKQADPIRPLARNARTGADLDEEAPNGPPISRDIEAFAA